MSYSDFQDLKLRFNQCLYFKSFEYYLYYLLCYLICFWRWCSLGILGFGHGWRSSFLVIWNLCCWKFGLVVLSVFGFFWWSRGSDFCLGRRVVGLVGWWTSLGYWLGMNLLRIHACVKCRRQCDVTLLELVIQQFLPLVHYKWMSTWNFSYLSSLLSLFSHWSKTSVSNKIFLRVTLIYSYFHLNFKTPI